YFYSEVGKAYLCSKVEAGDAVLGLDARPPLDLATLDATERFVAMAGGLPYFYGKILECASFCAEPYAGKESVLGEITMEDVKVTALLPEQRCTISSVAGHAMYERANPFYEYFLGGHIDMSACRYEQYDDT